MQFLSDIFQNKLLVDYLHELHLSQKWCLKRPNLKPGDIVFFKDKRRAKGVARNDLPLIVSEKTIKSKDNFGSNGCYPNLKT